MRTVLPKKRHVSLAAILGLVLLAMATLSAASASTANCSPTITKAPFGSVDGQAVDRYTLRNCDRMEVKILTYGGILQEIAVPDRRNKVANVTLGFDNLADYVAKSPYFGCITGRYANRIARGQFTLDGDDVPAGDQQRAEPPPRREQGLRQARLGGEPSRRPRRSASSSGTPARTERRTTPGR